MTCWSLNQKSRGREFWEIALAYSNYDFEYRLAMVSKFAYMSECHFLILIILESEFGYCKSRRIRNP